MVNNKQAFHELLTSTLKLSITNPIGLACNESGVLAVALEKEVLIINLNDYNAEDLGLFAFSLSFLGLGVTHSQKDKDNMSNNFPKIFFDLIERVRIVDNPSEIIYVATDPYEQVTDRATQAKIDALSNPAPLLPTPETSTLNTPEDVVSL
jgi:hypothetical protein